MHVTAMKRGMNTRDALKMMTTGDEKVKRLNAVMSILLLMIEEPNVYEYTAHEPEM